VADSKRHQRHSFRLKMFMRKLGYTLDEINRIMATEPGDDCRVAIRGR
jgi:hypothetical protein